MNSLQRNVQLVGVWEPSLTATFLPRCSNCEAVHPLARSPAIVTDKCPDCGTAVVTGASTTSKAVLTNRDPILAIGRMFLSIGQWLQQLGNKS